MAIDLEPASPVRIGTAGWGIPRAVADRFAGSGSHLQRYAAVFACAEINSTFKHVHRASTWARWAASTPPGFRFSVKLPHAITHQARLFDTIDPLERFLGEIAGLGDRLGPLLVQLPGSLGFEPVVVDAFFASLRQRFEGAVVCEPRHADWFSPSADAVYTRHRIGRVGADPARVPGAERPGGWLGGAGRRGVAYFRWHGAPQIYRSSYADTQLAEWAREARRWSEGADCWCVFDNTTSGAAAANALELARCVNAGGAVARCP